MTGVRARRIAAGPRRSQHHAWEPPAARQQVTYQCGRCGCEFTVTYHAGAEPPPAASCRCGGTGSAGSHDAAPAAPTEHERRMTQIRSRRTADQLEELLAERIAGMPSARKDTP